MPIYFKSLITDDLLKYGTLNSGLFPTNLASRLMEKNALMSMTTHDVYMQTRPPGQKKKVNLSYFHLETTAAG